MVRRSVTGRGLGERGERSTAGRGPRTRQQAPCSRAQPGLWPAIVDVMYDVTPALATLPDSFNTRQARAAGLTQPVLERLVRAQKITRVRRGLFRQTAVVDATAKRWQQVLDDHLARLGLALLAHPHHAASHLSAAALYGWPVRLNPASVVHLTVLDVEPRSRRVADRYLHHSDSITNDIERVRGLAVLRRERTVADCLRTMRPASAVAIADGALREGEVAAADVEQIIHRQRHWVGRPKARRALQLVDPARESWLESYSFVTLSEWGVELPLPQVEVFDATYRFVGRVDGLWLRHGTVAEADGAGKYLSGGSVDELPTSLSAARRVVAERKRERSLLDLGLQVVRWDTDEILKAPQSVVRRVAEARQSGDLGRFRGRLRHHGVWLDGPLSHPGTP